MAALHNFGPPAEVYRQVALAHGAKEDVAFANDLGYALRWKIFALGLIMVVSAALAVPIRRRLRPIRQIAWIAVPIVVLAYLAMPASWAEHPRHDPKHPELSHHWYHVALVPSAIVLVAVLITALVPLRHTHVADWFTLTRPEAAFKPWGNVGV